MSKRNGWIQAAEGLSVLFVRGTAQRVSITGESVEDVESALDDITERLTEINDGLNLWIDMPMDVEAWTVERAGAGWVEMTAPITVLSRQPTHYTANFNGTARENLCIDGDNGYTLCDMHMEQEASYTRRGDVWGYNGSDTWTPIPAPIPLAK